MFSPEDRNEFLRSIPSGGVIVEVGVLMGDYSANILRIAQPQTLYLVDAWQHINDTSDCAYSSQHDMEQRYRSVKDRFATNPEVVIVRATSPQVAGFVADEHCDMVYIDAFHRYDAVAADLEAWWPKVKFGGYLAGHDYFMNEWVDVQQAVDDFCTRRGLALDMLTTKDIPSWGIVRTAIASKSSAVLGAG